MKSHLLLSLLIVSAVCSEMLVTQEYTDYLRRHVTWEVADYESNVFRGWSLDEASAILSQTPVADEMQGTPVEVSEDETFPASVNWMERNANCVHDVRNEGNCGASWSFSSVGVISDRCCLRLKDHGWLSAQELISCDEDDYGCNGGTTTDVMAYAAKNGVVTETCYPYRAREEKCPTKCKDGSDWAKAHVCKCKTKVICKGAEAMKACIQSGPISCAMDVYKDFYYYKSGVYHHKSGDMIGRYAIRCYGYSATPEASWACASDWGVNWGDKGHVNIGKGEVNLDTYEATYCDPY